MLDFGIVASAVLIRSTQGGGSLISSVAFFGGAQRPSWTPYIGVRGLGDAAAGGKQVPGWFSASAERV